MISVFNSVSLQMIPATQSKFAWTGRKVSNEEASSLVSDGLVSFIGHADTARVLSGLLGVEVPFRRAFGVLSPGESVLVAQITGGRLPEGATTLPEGVKLQFWVVTAE